MARTPKFREDVKGQVAAEDCTASVREYGDYLTDRDLQTCFKRAQAGL